MRTKKTRATTRKTAGLCVEPPYGYAVAMPGLQELIEEAVCAPQASGTGGSNIEELAERLYRAVEGRDTEAEDAAFVDCMRAEVREGWKDFPNVGQLASTGELPDGEGKANLATIAASRLMRRDSRLPGHCCPTSRPRPGSTSSGSSKPRRIVLADRWGPLGDKRRPAALQYYIGRSRSSAPTSTLSGTSSRSFIAGATPSPARSPGGGRRLPAGSGDVPPGSLHHPIAPSDRPSSCTTSRFSSP